ncbi:MAG TPA: trypsin-like peptidase domain-containing protein [Candidatus Limnocylindria bacterium]|nr:trypsin-like peptidase domain-containing protein [Candidatus Limnocylindria bacterium]
MSRADRPYGDFVRADPPEHAPPPAAPDRPRRIPALARGLRDLVALALGAGMILLALGLIYAPPAALTEGDVEGVVGRVLASQTPSPPPGVGIWERTRHSVVLVRASVPREGGAGTQAGSGVVLDTRGTIITNEHIVRGATSITVTFSDGTESPADVAQTAPANDIAFLVPQRLPQAVVPAVLGDPRGLRPGDEAYVIGNPLGLARSLSAGVISGLDRSFQPRGGQILSGLIQFDAAVNPGNSGGPLINRDGDVVGIVTGLANPVNIDAFSGIGFAVPIDAAASGGGPPVH